MTTRAIAKRGDEGDRSAAAREMGVNVRGDGRGDENQRTSDDQLAGARSLLEEVRGKLTNKEAKHVARAIEHLNTALKIR